MGSFKMIQEVGRKHLLEMLKPKQKLVTWRPEPSNDHKTDREQTSHQLQDFNHDL